MVTLIVLFNLRPGTDPGAYETWARATDLPVVRALPSVNAFDVYRSRCLFGSAEPPPYAYIEVIQIAALDRFGDDVATTTMQAVAAEFRTFADNPVFILTDRIS